MRINYHFLIMVDRLIGIGRFISYHETRTWSSKRSLIYITAFLVNSALFNAQTTQLVFDIHYNNKVIGIVTALKIQKGSKIIEDLHTKTDSRVLMLEVHVESEINVTYTNNVLTKGVSYRHSNRGNENIQATTAKSTEKNYSIERNNRKQILKINEIDFCVIDLYFNEPVGKATVFSNMYGQYINITQQGPGKYKTVLPDGKSTTYIYKAGKLETIEVDMPIGKVISKRKNQ